MQRLNFLLFTIAILLGAQSQPLLAGFTLSLTIDAGGKVIVRPEGGAPMLPDPLDPSNVYFTKDNVPSGPLTIEGDSVQLVAIPTGFTVTVPTNPVLLAYGSDLILDLHTELGIRFIDWSGDLVLPYDPLNPDSQNPELNDYWIYAPTVSGADGITANFSNSVSDNAIDTVKLTFPLAADDPIDASSFEFLEDDNLSTVPIEGILRVTMNWADLLPRISLEQTNSIELYFADEGGNQLWAPLDLDVYSPSSVPEPTSWGLVSVVALGVLGWKRRKCSRAADNKRSQIV